MQSSCVQAHTLKFHTGSIPEKFQIQKVSTENPMHATNLKLRKSIMLMGEKNCSYIISPKFLYFGTSRIILSV